MRKDKNWKSNIIMFLLILNLAATGGMAAYQAGIFKTRDSEGTDSSLASQVQEAEKYTLYIGTNDKDTYTQIIPIDKARDLVNAICAKHVSGYTASEAKGGWVDETGTLTQENTLVYSFYNMEEEQITAIMDEVLEELNQNTILVEYGKTKSMYYGGTEGRWESD